MSKASTWATNYGKRPAIRTQRVRASVGNEGECIIENPSGGPVLTLAAIDALQLARWIFDYFSEEEDAHSQRGEAGDE